MPQGPLPQHLLQLNFSLTVFFLLISSVESGVLDTLWIIP